MDEAVRWTSSKRQEKEIKVIGIEKDAYELLDLIARKVDTVHVARLHSFLYDPEVIDPKNVGIK